MKFIELQLTNIGPFYGTNSFNFDSEKKLTLIGGQNGAGKTTFLKSVRLALYGPLAFGLKTTTPKYFNRVMNMINNQARAEKSENYSISITFSLVSNMERTTFKIIRNWKISHSMREDVMVLKNNKILGPKSQTLFFENLRTSFPPSLLELCLFDGEDIAKLTKNDFLSSYLKDLSNKLFNLDLFESLQTNLKKYLSSVDKTSEQAAYEDELTALKKEQVKNQQLVHDLNHEKETLQNDLDELIIRQKELKETFQTHGGLVKEQREKLLLRINTIEHERKNNSDSIKNFISRELPFFIMAKQVNNLTNQLKSEEDYFMSKVMHSKIQEINFSNILSDVDLSSDIAEKIKSKIGEQFKGDQEVDLIHNASNSEAQSIYSLNQQLKQEQFKSFVSLIEQNKELLVELKEARDSLKINAESTEFNDMVNEIESLSNQISLSENKLHIINSDKEELSSELTEIENKLNKVNLKLRNIYKTKESYGESEKVIRVTELFQNKQLRSKLRDAEYLSLKMIKSLMHKHAFIQNISIDPITFEIKLYNNKNELINQQVLSAGEKEIIVLSIIYGTIASSKKELPFILDTLLGRLDEEHKLAIVSTLLPSLGSQSIVLSTNSEINEGLYRSVKDQIAFEYTLNYIDTEQRSVIEHHFFDFDKVGGKYEF